MFKRIIIWLFILLVSGTGQFYLFQHFSAKTEQKADLDKPSASLGQAVANSIHQTVTDPYFLPLEKLALFLDSKPKTREIKMETLVNWAPDDNFPTCFVLDLDAKGWEIDHATSPWVLEGVFNFIESNLGVNGGSRDIAITSLKIEDETWWLGYLKIPPQSYQPRYVAGVFFSIDQYLARDVPRLLNIMTNRVRFPLTSFQRNKGQNLGRPDGHIAFQIFDDKGEMYYQSGKTFAEDKLIYSEKEWYDQTIVCMQRDWDIRVYSDNAELPIDFARNRLIMVLVILASSVLISLGFWLGIGGGSGQSQ